VAGDGVNVGVCTSNTYISKSCAAVVLGCRSEQKLPGYFARSIKRNEQNNEQNTDLGSLTNIRRKREREYFALLLFCS
jgi:hypothetical protein